MNINLLNNGFVIGRLVRDVEVKEKNGKKFAYVNVAVQRNYKNKETGEYESDFLSFIAGEQQVEYLAKYFAKGDVITINYSLFSNTKKNEDGKNITTEGKRIINATFVPGSKKKTSDEKKPELTNSANTDFAEITDEDDDLPF